MIEIYLFVHPFGVACYETEKKLVDFIQKHHQKINLQICPLVNLTTNRAVVQSSDRLSQDKTAQTAFLAHAYSAALDVKAAQLQGKKYARNFLLKLQTAILCHHTAYTPELVEILFAETGGDIEVFREDRKSNLIKELFWQDQEMARNFQIEKQNSAVLYNYDHECDGLLLNGPEAVQVIPKLCQSGYEDYLDSPLCNLKQGNGYVEQSISSLKLL